MPCSPSQFVAGRERADRSPAEGYPDLFDARIEEIIYMGDHVRVRVHVCAHDDFIIKVPRSREAPALAVGQTRTIGWHPGDCRALDVA